MIQGVAAGSGFGPDAQTEVGGGGRTGRVQNFGLVGVPLRETRVHNSAIGDGRVRSALGSEDDVPEADNGDAATALVVLHCECGGFDRGAERDGPGQEAVGVVHCGMAVTRAGTTLSRRVECKDSTYQEQHNKRNKQLTDDRFHWISPFGRQRPASGKLATKSGKRQWRGAEEG